MSAVVQETKKVHWASELHSEYRSTYRWHEFAGTAAAAGSGGVVRQPAPAPQTHVRDIFMGPTEPAMPRRKKYPGVAYKTNELFDPAAPAGVERLRSAVQNDRAARSTERSDVRNGSGRRSKSEGPRHPRWADTVETKGPTSTSLIGGEPGTLETTEYRKQFAWPKDTDGAPKKSISMGTLKNAAKKNQLVAEGSTELEPLMSDENVNEVHATKKHTEHLLWNGHKPALARKTSFRNVITSFLSGEERANRKRYKSEYKKKFRPFSQYVFEASKGTFTKCRAIKGNSLEKEEGSMEKMLPASGGDVVDSGRGQHISDAWVREVVEARKRAGEYKCRGWGTELAPEHLAHLYDKQLELWQQVSRRSSLAALALAQHKSIPAAEKEPESRSRSPRKTRSFRSAPQQSVHSKIQEIKQLERSPHKVQRKKLQGHSFDETATNQESKTDAAASRRASPRKSAASTAETRSPRRRPRSADPRPAAPLVNGHDPPKPAKPTDDDAISHRSASVAKDWDDSPVVKSPPEPTRVKSPEQMNMRSPDPVNWTVPLDTGKTFTVTQNVKNELAPVHQQVSPIRRRRGSGPRRDPSKTPTTPLSLTPIEEAKTLSIKPIANGSRSPADRKNGSRSPQNGSLSPADANGPVSPAVDKKLMEATQKGSTVDTAVVNPSSFGAGEMLERARSRFDKFWGGKKEDEV